MNCFMCGKPLPDFGLGDLKDMLQEHLEIYGYVPDPSSIRMACGECAEQAQLLSLKVYRQRTAWLN